MALCGPAPEDCQTSLWDGLVGKDSYHPLLIFRSDAIEQVWQGENNFQYFGRSLYSTDWNGDGFDDVFIGNEDQDTLQVFFGDSNINVQTSGSANILLEEILLLDLVMLFNQEIWTVMVLRSLQFQLRQPLMVQLVVRLLYTLLFLLQNPSAQLSCKLREIPLVSLVLEMIFQLGM